MTTCLNWHCMVTCYTIDISIIHVCSLQVAGVRLLVFEDDMNAYFETRIFGQQVCTVNKLHLHEHL